MFENNNINITVNKLYSIFILNFDYRFSKVFSRGYGKYNRYGEFQILTISLTYIQI